MQAQVYQFHDVFVLALTDVENGPLNAAVRHVAALDFLADQQNLSFENRVVGASGPACIVGIVGNPVLNQRRAVCMELLRINR
jgi:hypothetical protein